MPVRKRKPESVYFSEIHADFQKSSINDVRLGYNGKAVADSIFYILNTRKGERVMLSEFGSNLKHLLFEPVDMQTALDIEMETKDALERWEPRVVIEDVQIIPNYEKDSYECSIKFFIRGLESDLQEINIDFYRTYY